MADPAVDEIFQSIGAAPRDVAVPNGDDEIDRLLDEVRSAKPPAPEPIPEPEQAPVKAVQPAPKAEGGSGIFDMLARVAWAGVEGPRAIGSMTSKLMAGEEPTLPKPLLSSVTPEPVQQAVGKTAETGLNILDYFTAPLSRGPHQYMKTTADAFLQPNMGVANRAATLMSAPVRGMLAMVFPSTQDIPVAESIHQYHYDPTLNGDSWPTRWAKGGAELLHSVAADLGNLVTLGTPKALGALSSGGRLFKMTERGAKEILPKIAAAVEKAMPEASTWLKEEEVARQFMKKYPEEIARPIVKVGPWEVPHSGETIQEVVDLYKKAKEAVTGMPPEVSNEIAMVKAARMSSESREAGETTEVFQARQQLKKSIKATEEQVRAETTAISQSGVLEDAPDGIDFQRKMDALSPERQQYVLRYRARFPEMLKTEQLVDVPVRQLGEAQQAKFDLLQIDRGAKERYVATLTDQEAALLKEANRLEKLSTSDLNKIAAEKPDMFSLQTFENIPNNEDMVRGVFVERARAMREQINRVAMQRAAAERQYATLGDEVSALEKQGTSKYAYVAHLITDEAREVMERVKPQKFRGLGARLTDDHASTIAREINMPVYQANELSLAGKMPGYENIKFKMFHDDPEIIAMMRAGRHIRSTEGANLAKNLAAFGDGWKPPADWTPAEAAKYAMEHPKYKDYVPVTGPLADHPALKDMWFDKRTVKEINKYTSTTPKDFNGLLHAYDTILNTWKVWTLMPFPGTGLRDLEGGMWNAHLAGSFDRGPGVAATNMTHAIKVVAGRATGEIDAAGKKIGYQALRREAARNNIFKAGLIGESGLQAGEPSWRAMLAGSSNRKNLLQKISGGIDTVLGVQSPAIKYFYKVRQGSDDMIRMYMFIDRLQKGDSFAAAAGTVKKYLFSSEMLAPWERAGAVRAIPFYRWTRMNIPLQLEEMIKSPGKFGVLEHARQNIEKQMIDPQDKDWMARHISYSFDIPWKRDAQTGEYKFLIMRSWMPFADILSLQQPFAYKNMEEGMKQFTLNGPVGITSLAPPFQLGMQFGLDVDAQTGRKLSTMGPGRFLGQEVDSPILQKALSNIRILKFIDDFTKTNRSPNEKSPAEVVGKWAGGITTSRQNIPFNQRRSALNRQEFLRALVGAARRAGEKGDMKLVQHIIDRMNEEGALPLEEWRD